MTIVAVGDAITVEVVMHQERGKQFAYGFRNTWTMKATHNGCVVRDETYDTESAARIAAMALVEFAVREAEGVVFTWR